MEQFNFGLIQINWIFPLNRSQISEELQLVSGTKLCEILSYPQLLVCSVWGVAGSSGPRCPRQQPYHLGCCHWCWVFRVWEKGSSSRVSTFQDWPHPHASPRDQLWLKLHVLDQFLPNICMSFSVNVWWHFKAALSNGWERHLQSQQWLVKCQFHHMTLESHLTVMGFCSFICKMLITIVWWG